VRLVARRAGNPLQGVGRSALGVAVVLLALGLAVAGCGKKKEPPAGKQAQEGSGETVRPTPSPGGGTADAGRSGADQREAWTPFQFRAGQYFKYSIAAPDGGQMKKGWFSLELKPAGGDQMEAVWQGELEGGRFSFRHTGPMETITNPASVAMMAALSGGPAAMPVLMAAGATVFTPWYGLAFMNQTLVLGAGWEFTSPEGDSVSVKVAERCKEAGIAGYLVRLEGRAKEGKRDRIEACVSPRSPLALSTRVWEDEHLQYEAVLQEQRGL